MVLPNVNGQPPDSFNDNPYPSENDPYASSSSPNRFDASSFPQPIPIMGSVLGFSPANVRFKAESTIKFAEQKVARQLTPEEAQALASHIYKMEQRKSYFTCTGASIGTWRWYNTMHENRYPFYKPTPEDVNPNKFLFVKGPWAQYARHSWRLFAYMFVAGQMGKLIGQIIAQPLAAQDTSKDARLEQFGRDLSAALSSDAQNATAREKEWRDRINRERASREQARGAVPSPKEQWNQTPTQKDDDDMSPTAGNEPWGWSDSNFSSDFQKGVSQQRPPVVGTPRRPDDDADTSPTGGLFQEESQSRNQPQPQQQPQSGGSTWERLRRGGAPAPLQRPPLSRRSELPGGERKEESSLGDSFTFVEDEEERRREREKAQREFDARIERERQGKDFTDDGKRW